MKNFRDILLRARSKKSRFRAFRLILVLFVAFLLPLAQAANIAHLIANEHTTQYHGHKHSTNDLHHSDKHSDSDHHDRSFDIDGQPHHDHTSDSDHHTATDHLETLHVWKPNSKVFHSTLVAILAIHLEIFVTSPPTLSWPRDQKQHLGSLSSGPPPQLRAPPAHS